MHGAGFVSRRETAHWSSGLAHKGWMCSSETPRGETGAEPCRSRLVVDKGTRDSRAATARSPASRRRELSRGWSLPRFLDHQAGRMWSFVLYAGSSPAISFACAPSSLASASVVTTRPGVGVGRVLLCGRIPPPESPSSLEVASGGLGTRSSKPHPGIYEAI